jgi:L,D-peptidoglycan transpeptidase YkuD (ErfK/YbiS/YcfS/YnhG family)
MNIVVRRQGEFYFADWGTGETRCAVGRGGIAEKLREGDGVTPLGAWPLRQVLYRPDRLTAPSSVLAVSALHEHDGWCESPNDPDYNRPVRLPHRSGSESMWRADDLYDVVLVVGYNDAPVIPGRGSAIFVHVARPDFSPTAGCVALTLPDLLDALAQLNKEDTLIVRR